MHIFMVWFVQFIILWEVTNNANIDNDINIFVFFDKQSNIFTDMLFLSY